MAIRPITEIAERLGLTDDLIEPYGRYTAKIRLETLGRFPARRGKLILVTAITPTTSGEGKTVTTITGVPLAEEALKELATSLKKRCGTGGALKDGVIEIQGDHVELLLAELIKLGYKAKKSGG